MRLDAEGESVTEVKAELASLSFDLAGKQTLSLALHADGRALYDAYKDKLLTVSVKEYRQKRSLDANAYFWVLCDRLAEHLKIPKEDIYKEYIQNVGGNSYISPVLDAEKDKAIRFWESRGLGWFCEDTGTSKLAGCTNIIFYAGSSAFDTAQMSRLIDNIVQDCKAVGIETLTPEELLRIKEDWK